jgi:SAM-dependent methyltransferase
MNVSNISLFSKVKDYRKLEKKLQTILTKYPYEWPKFQRTFNSVLDKIYQEILQFERDNIIRFESKVYKLRRIFEKRYRRFFLYGEFIKWSLDKPYGYAGDFKIIDNIYQNRPQTTGFDRLWDNYFQQLPISEATRERKEDFKKIILEFVKEHKNKNIRIMNLASGPAREIKELLDSDSERLFSRVIFDCYDFDIRAINYAKQLLNGVNNINFLQKNAVRLAFKKNIKNEISHDYDLIYSTGLFDYLDETVATRLIRNLKKILKESGIIVISNVGDKYNNPSASWMEWVAEWYLIYRTEFEFKKIFWDADISPVNLRIIPQRSKVMQYCFASKSFNLSEVLPESKIKL